MVIAKPSNSAGFAPAPTRLVGELAERQAMAARAMSYGLAFLDDALRGILPHDLVLLGAPSGVGKTDLAVAIAARNCRESRRVAYFALEAEPREIERRIKYAMLVTRLNDMRHPRLGAMNYADWMFGRCEDICGSYNAEVDRAIGQQLASLKTFYRGLRFERSDLQQAMEAVGRDVELIVIDHAHYIDNDESNENRGLSDTVKAIRDSSLVLGVPVLLVAHLRKRDPRARQLVASLDDFHGSSNLAKICTHAVTIEPARSLSASKWYEAPTFVAVLKDRRMGAPPFVAATMFDRRTRRYDQTYQLGTLREGGTLWEPVAPGDAPAWAVAHRALASLR